MEFSVIPRRMNEQIELLLAGYLSAGVACGWLSTRNDRGWGRGAEKSKKGYFISNPGPNIPLVMSLGE